MVIKTNIHIPAARTIVFIILISFCAVLFTPFMGAEDTGSSPSSRVVTFNTELIFDEELDDGVLTLYPEDRYFFYIRVTNTWTQNDTYRLEISGVHSGWSIVFSDKSVETEIDIAGGDGTNSEDVLIIVKIPETAKKNEYSDLEIKVTSINTETGITPEGTTTLVENLMIVINYIEPHVILETKESTLDVFPAGDPASFIINVQNLGFETLDYYPPEPQELMLPEDWSAEIPMASTAMPLAPATEDYFIVNITAPSDAGVFERVRVTVEGSVSSQNTTILPVELTVSVKQIHDLEIAGPKEFTVLEPLKTMGYELTVRNDGNGPENVLFSLNTPAGTTSWDSLISDSSYVLSAGNQHTITINFTPVSDAKNGEYQFNFVANLMDSDKIVQTEIFATAVTINYVPDLAIEDSDITFSDAFLEPEQVVTINATIHNKGIVPAYNVTVAFDLTTKGGSKKSIGEQTLDVIPAGQSVSISIDWSVDPATSLISVELDPDNSRPETDELNNIGAQTVVILQPHSAPPASDSSGFSGFMGIGTVGSIVVLTALISITAAMAVVSLSTEAGRYGLLTAFAPLYTKVRREDVLLHETREMVYDYVKSHPGEHFRAIMNKLSLTNGTLAHHLYTLEKQEFIKSERDGPYKRFYPRGYKFTGSVMEINGLQKKILDAIEEAPGITQKQLAKVLGISPPTVNYHIKTMTGARLVDVQRNGKETQLFRIKAE
jgi:uncharacterized membrane protein/DNA-binding MarR family transcriptional regulator